MSQAVVSHGGSVHNSVRGDESHNRGKQQIIITNAMQKVMMGGAPSTPFDARRASEFFKTPPPSNLFQGGSAAAGGTQEFAHNNNTLSSMTMMMGETLQGALMQSRTVNSNGGVTM